MDKTHYIAPCGVNCLNCKIHESNLTEEYKAKAAEHLDVSPDKVRCRGCRPEQGKCKLLPSECATWLCTREKGVTYCFECDEFPCTLLAPSAKGAHLLHNAKLYNLCRMKFFGIDAWLEESAQIQQLYFEGEFVVGKGPVLNHGENQ